MGDTQTWNVARETWGSQKEHWKEITGRIGAWTRVLPWNRPECVFWVGEGSSLHAAVLTANLLEPGGSSRWKIPPRWQGVCASSEFDQQAGRLQGDRQWFVGFSHRGKTTATRKALERAQARGFYTVWIASKELEEGHVDADLFVPAGPMEKVEPHTTALTSAIVAASTLLGDPELKDMWLAESLAPAEKELPEALQGVEEGTWVVGHGAAEWMAKEFALKCLELGGPLLRPVGSEAFFHGPSQFLPGRGKPPSVLWLDGGNDPRMEDWEARYRPEGVAIQRLSLGDLANSPSHTLRALLNLQGLALRLTQA
jgi:fructoselysine-6-P-deglycase FrlB-like protein